MEENNVNCSKLTFKECETAILRMQVKAAQTKIAKRELSSDKMQNIIKIAEDFIKNNDVICYGGTAINNILPKKAQFYDRTVDMADYDFFTTDGLKCAKDLADIFFKNGYTDIEAKSAQHKETYKVFVNFISVADISTVPKSIYDSLKKNAIVIDNIYYVPPNFLRMAIYVELSRPAGYTDRWEKLVPRLQLLNEHYPIKANNCHLNNTNKLLNTNEDVNEVIFHTLVDENVVFFGGAAISQYLSSKKGNKLEKEDKSDDLDEDDSNDLDEDNSNDSNDSTDLKNGKNGKKGKKVVNGNHYNVNATDVYVLARNPLKTANAVIDALKKININAEKIYQDAIGDIIPERYDIKIKKVVVASIYKPIACHSYNVINMDGKKVFIATIETMLSFYLAFLYINNPYEVSEKMLCMSKDLLDLQEKHKLDQKGIFKRYTITCYGHQPSQQEMREEKAKMYEKLKHKIGTLEYNKWFYNYKPSKVMSNKTMNNKTMNNKQNYLKNNNNKYVQNNQNEDEDEDEDENKQNKPKKTRKARKKKYTFVNPYDTRKKHKFW